MNFLIIHHQFLHSQAIVNFLLCPHKHILIQLIYNDIHHPLIDNIQYHHIDGYFPDIDSSHINHACSLQVYIYFHPFKVIHNPVRINLLLSIPPFPLLFISSLCVSLAYQPQLTKSVINFVFFI